MNDSPNYNIEKVIGSGCFGFVFEATNKKTNKKVALKRIQKVGTQLSREYEILFMIKDFQNVVQMEDFFYTKNDKNKLIQNIVFEFVQDNLQNLIEMNIKQKTEIPQIQIKRYVYQLLNGLKNIHSINIAHRDLKPQNVLLSKKGVIKICDFGSSKVIDPKGKNTPYIVSRYYRAPQLILCLTKYSTGIDIWATGCILAQLYLLTPFFKGKTQGDQLFSIFRNMGSLNKNQKAQYKQRVPFDPCLIDQFSEFQKIDLKKKFEMSKDKSNLIDLLQQMLKYLPQQRITAEQAMKHKYFNQIRQQYTKKISPISKYVTN